MLDEGGKWDEGKAVQHVLHMGTLLDFIFNQSVKANQGPSVAGEALGEKNSQIFSLINECLEYVRHNMKDVDPFGGCAATYAGLVPGAATRCKTDMSLSFPKPR